MKRTTYVMIGMLVAGLVLVCGIIFSLSRYSVAWEETFWKIGGDLHTVQLPPCRVLKLSGPATVWEQKREGVVECKRAFSFQRLPLDIAGGDSLQGGFCYACDMDPFISVTSVGDTLSIAFDFPEEKVDKRFRDEAWIKLSSYRMALRLPVGVQEVLVDVEGMETTFWGVYCDTLSFRVRDSAKLEDCCITSLSAQAQSLYFNSGEVRDLHLNLDEISTWHVDVDSFRVDTEHLSGSDVHHNTLQKGECRQLIWTPLKEGAALDVRMQQAGKIELE